jgi:hypothetical protein
LTKLPIRYMEEKIPSLTNGAGKTGFSLAGV